MGDEVEEVFLKVGAVQGGRVNLIGSDHIRQRRPSSAVLIAPARVTIMASPLIQLDPRLRCVGGRDGVKWRNVAP